MDTEQILSGVLLEEDTIVSFAEIRQRCQIPEEWLLDLMEQGLFEAESENFDTVQLSHATIQRILSAWRLHKQLHLNSSGAVLVLELVEELEQMRKELKILKRQANF